MVVQFDTQGRPFNCWKMQGVSIDNEPHSDGVWWKDSAGHLIHISGWYNRVQVAGGNFTSAAQALGVDADRCTNGVYKAEAR